MKPIAFIFVFMSVGISSLISAASSDLEIDMESSSFQIEGKVAPPDPKPKDWYWTTKITLEGGKRMAYLKVKVYDLLLIVLTLQVILFDGNRRIILSPSLACHRARICWK